MKVKQKIIAIVLTILILGAQLLSLGSQVIAANVTEQNSKTNHSNVTFNSYFKEGKHEQKYKVGEEAKLYLAINVYNTGYLKNAIVSISENANYEIDTSNLNNELIQQASNSQVKLKQIYSGNEVLIELPIKIKTANQVEKDFIEKESQVIFNATYIDSNGQEKNIYKEINNKLTWEADLELELNSEVTKYIPFNYGEKYGVLLQTKISSKLKDHILPISKTELTIQVPQMEGVKPGNINVIANKTTNTNSDETGDQFNTSNYQYNIEEGILTINTFNQENENGMVANKQNGIDEYIVNFIYEGEEIYNKVQNKNYSGINNVLAKVTLANTEQTEIQKSIESTYNEEEIKGTLTDITVKTKSSISKGNIYANYDRKEENKQETVYDVNYKVQINELTVTDKIQMQTAKENYLDEAENKYPVGNGIYVKQIKIEESNFINILGEEGTIEISKLDGTVIGTINKSTNKQDNYFILDLTQENVAEVNIKTSKPVLAGNMKITLQKAIMANQEYLKEEIKNFKKMETAVINKSLKENIETKAVILLEEPVSKAEITIPAEKQNLSTVVENKNVEIKVVLNTSKVNNALYKNPILEIELPSQIEKVNINNVNLLLEEELKIKGKPKVVKKQGKNVIQIVLEGTQTKYAQPIESSSENIISKGANIIINANITVNKFVASSKEQIVLYYTNENTDLYENSTEIENSVVGTAATNVNIAAPTGMAVINKITGFNGENSELLALNGNAEHAIIQTHAKQKTATVEGIITNNNEGKVENVVILGRIPSKGNKTVDGEELGSTFTAPMTRKIQVKGIDNSNVKVYYSTNEEVTKDVELKENNWTENPSNLTNIKNYLIVIEGGIEKSSQIRFNYEVQIPEELKTNNSTYETYKVYYDNKANETTINETKIAGTLGLITENAPELQVTLKSNKEENSTVQTGQIIDFTVEVTNIGKQEAKDVTIKVPVPKEAIYTEYDFYTNNFIYSNEEEISLKIGNIPVNETAKKTYQLKILYANKNSMSHKVEVTAQELSNPITSNEYVLNVTEAKLQLELSSTRNTSSPFIKGNVTIAMLNIQAFQDLENVVITIDVPDGITVEELTYEDNNFEEKDYAKVQDGKVVLTIEKLEKGHHGSLETKIKVGEYTGEFKLFAKGVANNIEEVMSNEFIYNIGKVNLEITQKDPSQTYIKEAEEVTFGFEIKNNSGFTAYNVIFKDVLPEGLTIKKVIYTEDDGKTIEGIPMANNTATVQWRLFESNTTQTVKVIAEANLLKDINEEKSISNVGTVIASGIDTITSNTKTITVECNSKLYDENGAPSSSASHAIKGTAWLDENKNGQREETEKLLSGIQVILVKANSGETVKDITTGNEKTTTTAENGTYEFTNVPYGDYIVVFNYDASKYSITDYQKEGVGLGYNSDAISMLITLNGVQTYAGITNTINLTSGVVRDIDIGLYVSEKFDLKLDKYISKLTIVSGGNTKVHNLNNSKLQKVEIKKKNINNSSLIIEYKIVVTNEGKLPGYVRKIVDYLPEGTRFNSELNEDWYVSSGNTAYNNKLENVLLNPGESKEVTLILSAVVTDENMGKFINNNAEIYEAYNEQGSIDMDSSPANMLENEDDMSKADIILTVATGSTILYISLILAVLLILIIGIVIIKRKVLDKKDEIGL